MGGRGNFWIRKEKFADSKIRVDVTEGVYLNPRSDQKSGSLGFFVKKTNDVSKKRIIFYPLPWKRPKISTVSRGRIKNTAADTVTSLLILHFILDDKLKDTALDGPSEDESCKTRERSCQAVLSLLTRAMQVPFAPGFSHSDKADKIDRPVQKMSSVVKS